jgi:hypothetical protein
MASRPKHINIPDSLKVPDPLNRPLFTPHGSALPGDVPPALSPLDAFAMQSRLLAKKFEEGDNDGRRMSRLPPTAITSEFSKPRPGFYRSVTTGSHTLTTNAEFPDEDSYFHTAAEVRVVSRPKSHYPQMVQTDSLIGAPQRWQDFRKELGDVEEQEQDVETPLGLYNVPRSYSPDAFEAAPQSTPRHHDLNNSPPLSLSHHYSPPNSALTHAVAPSLLVPQANASNRSLGTSPSIRAVLADSSDDLSQSSVANSLDSLSLEKPNPPFQNQAYVARSPSQASSRSISSIAPRPSFTSFNYSRPLSSQSRVLDEPQRQGDSLSRLGSGASRSSYRQDSGDFPLTPFSNDAPHTPVSLTSEDTFPPESRRDSSTPTSYVYAKYALNKQKVNRESIGAEEFLSRHINWDDPNTDPQLALPFRPLAFLPKSPPSPALTNSPPVGRRGRLDDYSGSPKPAGRRRRLTKSRPNTRPTTPATIASSDASTIKGSTSQPSLPPAPLPDPGAEVHLEMGIELHEKGALAESTYHFRLAAKAGSPTAMLLYALACRHGWGMKANAAEGVSWLTKAVNSAQLEMAEDEDIVKSGRTLDIMDSKSHKAQFALSVYELGMSYMNGWGVDQDRPLALRCFEIAGNWGDADALSEAAYCYKEGIGCKKDTKHSAKLYRMAEAKGVTVAGNSW